MTIQFGLNATNQYTTWPEYLQLAQTAEAAGLDSFWVFDHFVPGPTDPRGSALECLTTMSALAALTSRITLGSLVLGVTYRNPALVAKMHTQVDVIAGGRTILGLGAAWYGLEHRMYGIPFPAPGERVSRLSETLQVIKAIWTSQPASFSGQYYQIEDLLLDPAPVSQPHPPILVGARGERALRLVARYADLYNSAADVGTIAQQNAQIDANCRAIGRDPNEIGRTAIVLHSFAATPERERAKQERLSQIFSQPFGNLAGRVLSGSDDQVVEMLGRYVEAGTSHFMLSCMAPYDLEAVERLAVKIAPQIRHLSPPRRN